MVVWGCVFQFWGYIWRALNPKDDSALGLIPTEQKYYMAFSIQFKFSDKAKWYLLHILWVITYTYRVLQTRINFGEKLTEHPISPITMFMPCEITLNYFSLFGSDDHSRSWPADLKYRPCWCPTSSSSPSGNAWSGLTWLPRLDVLISYMEQFLNICVATFVKLGYF